MIEKPTMFDKYGVAWFYKKTKKCFFISRRYFFDKESAEDFYYKVLRHNHEKTLFQLPDENNKENFILDSESINLY